MQRLSIPKDKIERIKRLLPEFSGVNYSWEDSLRLWSDDEVALQRAVLMVRCEVERKTWPLFLALFLRPESTLPLESFWQRARSSIAYADSMINPLSKLHLTVSMIWAPDVEPVKHLMQTIAIIKPFSVNLKGIDVMVGDAEHAQVLYAKVEPCAELSLLEQSLLPQLADLGVISRMTVKWHCTLLNAVYAMRRLKLYHLPLFDAREILSEFEHYDFGVFHVDSIQLCHTSASSPNPNYYKAEFIKFF